MIGTRVAFRGAFGPHSPQHNPFEDSVILKVEKNDTLGNRRPSDDLENEPAAAFDSGRGVALQSDSAEGENNASWKRCSPAVRQCGG
jgi:hypothetical protein